MRIFLVASLLAACAPVWSDILPPTLPPAFTIATCTQSLEFKTDPTGCALELAMADVSTSDAKVEADAESDPSPFGTGAAARLTYQFAALGGSPGDLVPVDIFVKLFARASNSNAQAMASIAVSTLADGTATTPCVAAGTNACGGIHELEDDIIVFVGSGDILNFVTLFATASTSPVPPDQDSVSALASADPLIFVDPNFPGASQYSIVLSPGVGNGLASTVPEPGTGVLLAVPVGFFFACRIRKQSS